MFSGRSDGLAHKAAAFVVLVVVGFTGLVFITALDPFGGNVLLTALLEAALVGAVAYALTYAVVPTMKRSALGRARDHSVREQ